MMKQIIARKRFLAITAALSILCLCLCGSFAAVSAEDGYYTIVTPEGVTGVARAYSGDTVTLTVTAPQDEILKGGVLYYSYYIGGTEVRLPLYRRLNSEIYKTGTYSDTPSNQFVFEMPAADVTVIADFVEASDAAENYLSVFGTSYISAGEVGLQFGARLRKSIVWGGEGETYTLYSFGTLLVHAGSSAAGLSQPDAGQMWKDFLSGNAQWNEHWKNLPATTLMDRCTEHVDIAARLVNMFGYEATEYAAVVYAFYTPEDGGAPLYLEAPAGTAASLNSSMSKAQTVGEYNPANLIRNPGFELGDRSGFVDVNAESTFSVITGAPGAETHAGLYAAKFAGLDTNKNTHQKVSVKPNSDYTLTFWAKIGDKQRESGAYGGSVRAQTTAYASLNAVQSIPAAGTVNWTQFTINFNSGNNREILITIINEGYDQYFDDFVLTGPDPDNLLINAGFETGANTGYTSSELSGGFSIVTDTVLAGRYAARIGSSNYKSLYQKVSVLPNTDYTLSAWIKMGNKPAGTYAGSLNAYTIGWGTKLGGVTITNDEVGLWKKFTVTFNSGGNSEIYVSILNETRDQYVDDIVLSGPAPENLVSNSGFETGDKTGYTVAGALAGLSVVKDKAIAGRYCAKSHASGSGNFYQAITVVADQSYTASVWIKTGPKITDKYGGSFTIYAANWSTNLGSTNIDSSGDGVWRNYTFTFNSGSNTKVFINFANFGLDQYIDNIIIRKVS